MIPRNRLHSNDSHFLRRNHLQGAVFNIQVDAFLPLANRNKRVRRIKDLTQRRLNLYAIAPLRE